MDEESVIFVTSLIAIISSGFGLFTLTITLLDGKIRNRASTVPITSFLVASVLQGALALPMYVYRKLSGNRSALGLCDLYRVPYFFCGHILTMSLFYVSLDRLFVITRPFMYKDYVTTPRFTLLIIVSWLATAIIDSIPFIVSSSFTDDCVYEPNMDWGVCVIIIYIIIPLITIVASYSFIWVKAVKIAMEDNKLRIQTQSRFTDLSPPSGNCVDDANSDNGKHRKTKKIEISIVELKATKTSIVLVVTYILCWGPLGIFYMIDHFCGNCYSSNGKLSAFRTAIKILALASSFVAPVVYCWWNKEFRKATRKIFKKYMIKAGL